MLGPDLPHPTKMVKGSQRWDLPTYHKVDIETPLVYIKERMLWGKPPPPPGISLPEEKPDPATRPDWRILSSVISENESYVTIQIGNQPVIDLHPGQLLPDGSQIVRIESDRLYLNIKGYKRILPLFPE